MNKTYPPNYYCLQLLKTAPINFPPHPQLIKAFINQYPTSILVKANDNLDYSHFSSDNDLLYVIFNHQDKLKIFKITMIKGSNKSLNFEVALVNTDDLRTIERISRQMLYCFGHEKERELFISRFSRHLIRNPTDSSSNLLLSELDKLEIIKSLNDNPASTSSLNKTNLKI